MFRKMVAAGLIAMACTGCGGGSDSDDDNKPDLVGTWIQTNDNYFTATDETFKIRRQTIIVTDLGDYLEFTDCISGNTLKAKINNNLVQFYAAGVPSLTIANTSTLTTLIRGGSTETRVEMKKVSRDTTVELADIAITQPEILSTWDQVCVETILDQFLDDEVKFKAVNETSAFTLGVNLMFDGDIAATTYDFSTGTNDADGSITSLTLNADLFDPAGTIAVVDGTSIDFDMDLEFDNSANSSALPVVGSVEFDLNWFSYD